MDWVEWIGLNDKIVGSDKLVVRGLCCGEEKRFVLLKRGCFC
jgi:hypothetical protein